MSRYVEFTLPDGTTFKMESEEEGEGLVKAGFGETLQQASEAFIQGVRKAVQSARVVLQEVLEENAPDEVELTFGLKASAEFKTLVIADAGAEGSYSVKMTWKKPAVKASGPKSD